MSFTALCRFLCGGVFVAALVHLAACRDAKGAAAGAAAGAAPDGGQDF